jgi:EAL domain-containing protein (putative c-di-GMP-specific phosphodiesterase class I)/FixJ family two-component response regulator
MYFGRFRTDIEDKTLERFTLQKFLECAETMRVAVIPLQSVGDAARSIAGAVVLVVDDGEANVLLLDRLLSRAGARRVITVTDPRRAVETFVTEDPDLVLLDLHMPHMDGLSVLAALQSAIPAGEFVPVIVLTADTTIDAKNQALASGAKDFLTKPFEQTEVLLRVSNLLETRSLQQELRRHNAELEETIRRKEEQERLLAQEWAERESRVRQAITGRDLTMVFQPIADLRSGATTGFEALARFSQAPVRPPNEWFAEAASVGLETDLELKAVESAVEALDLLPPGTYLSVNVSPQTMVDRRLQDVLRPVADRIVVELTEHAAVDEYEKLLAATGALRAMGARIAVDDAGSGYSSFQHILQVCPDIIKLDLDLTRGIHADPARRALGLALVAFSIEIGADVIAEGIEEAEELHTLREIGVGCGQGYLLGRPGPPSAA